MEKDELIEKFSEFLNEFYLEELVTALTENKKSISIDFALLDKFDVELADCFFETPEEMLEAAEEAVKQIDTGLGEAKLRVRFFNMPGSKEIRIRNVRAEHISKLIVVDGIVKRASEVRPEVSEGIFSCPECGARISVIQTDQFISAPTRCDCGCHRGFKLIDQRMYDARWITIEEPFEITTGEQPSDIMVFLKEDLTTPLLQTRTDPGNRIKVVGVLKQIPKRIKGTRSRQLDIYIDANYVEPIEVGWEELLITPEDEEKIITLAKDPLIYDKLISSLAPTIYGWSEVKEAMILQMFSGEQHVLRDKTRIRGNIHLLLVGDPACLVADERVVMADGTIMKIGEMGSTHLQKIDFRVHMGMGRNCGRANLFHVYKNQPVIEIITETGKSVKGTYNQPILVVEDRCQSWKRLDEIKIGDRVQVLPKIECRKKTFVKTNWSDYPYYHKSWRIKIPCFVDEELAGLFGYILADGWVEKRRIGFVVNSDESDILPKIESFFRNCFDAPITSYNHPTASKKITYYQVCRTHLAKLLSFLNEKRAPDHVFQSGNEAVATFLRWLYEGDGSVFSKGRGRTSVSLRSNSIELLRDVQLLLLRFGIHARILWDEKPRTTKIKGREISNAPSGSLMIRRSESIIKFWEKIGFVSKKKNDKLGKVVEYAKAHIHRIHRSRTEKIVKINKLPPQDVFDIEVPKHNRFVANGIVVHNTAKSQLMKLASTLIPRGKYASGTAVTGAGLCTIYDTLIQEENGTLVKIGKLVEEEFKNSKVEPKKLKEGIYFVDGYSTRRIMSFDQDRLKVKPSKITKYWKIKAPGKLVKISTKSGKQIVVTTKNPIPVIKEGKIIWKHAIEISPTDYIATPRTLNLKSNLTPLTDNISGNAWILNEGIDLEKIVELIKSKESIRSFCNRLNLKENDLYHNWKTYKSPHGIVHRGAPTVSEIAKICGELGLKVEDVLPDELVLSKRPGHKIKLPLFMNSKIAYLMGLLAGDGSISKTGYGGFDIKFFNIHNGLLDSYMQLCNSELNIEPSSEKDRNGIPCIRFRSKIFGDMLNRFGIVGGDKSHNLYVSEELSRLPNDLLACYLRGVFDTDGSVIKRATRGSNYVELSSASENFIRGVQILLLRYGIFSLAKEKKPRKSIIRGREVKSGKRYILIIGGLENLKTFRDSINFNCEEKSKKLEEIIVKLSKAHNNIDLIPEIGKLIRHTREKLGLSAEQFYGYQNYSYETGRRKPTRKFLSNLINRFGREKLVELEKFAKSDVFWDRIGNIEIIENKEHEYVYDVTVEDEHSFVANGLVIHNTATVTKDEQFFGGWVLEAGALVLANRSICAIDEFSHVAPDDMIKLQEAMSLETISIAKASIVASLPAQTAILAGANPKFGRFDPYLPIKEQLDQINEVMLSRFDLRFALRDVPNPETDAKIAEHILKMRHFEEESAVPQIDPTLLRKYIAYARANVHPVLTKEAGEMMKEFYLLMRSKSGEDSPVSITLRQYESLIRLGEASAKIRLSETVDVEDAQRAITLMSFSLRQFGFEPETGKIDIDRVEGQKMTSVQRSKTKIMIDVINALEAEIGKDIPKDEVIRRAMEEGISNAEDMLSMMLSEGMLYQPNPNIVRKI